MPISSSNQPSSNGKFAEPVRKILQKSVLDLERGSAGRLFPGYLNRLTPLVVAIEAIHVEAGRTGEDYVDHERLLQIFLENRPRSKPFCQKRKDDWE